VESNFTSKKLASEAAAFYGWLHPQMLQELKDIIQGSLAEATAEFEPGTPLHKYWHIVKATCPFLAASAEDNFKHMLISNAQTEANIGDVEDRITSVDSAKLKTEKISDVLAVKRPIARRLVYAGNIKRERFRSGVLYAELPYRTLRSIKSRQSYLTDLKKLSADLTDVHKLKGSPRLKKRAIGQGKKTQQRASAKSRIVEEMNANTFAAAQKGYSLNSDSVSIAITQADDSKWADLDMLPVVAVDYVLTLKTVELVAFLETMDIESMRRSSRQRIKAKRQVY